MADSASPELVALYRERRALAPVFFDEQAKSWFVYRYDDVKAIMADWKTFSSDYQTHAPGWGLSKIFEGMMLGLDPPRQVKLRSILTRAFTPRSVEELGPKINTAVRGLIANFKHQGRCELIEDFAGAVPVLALADFLGVPGEKHPYFREIVLRYSRSFDAILAGKPLDTRPQEELDAYFTVLTEERRQSPRDDLVSRLLAAEVDGEHLSQTELLGFCRLLLTAGITTTARLIGAAVQTFLENPGELARLRADPRLMPSAVEEVMRYRPPVNTWFRVTAKQAELAGQRIPAKQQMLLVLGSANRDEAHFADPDRFDITRSPNPHLGLGTGIHFCLGAPLARLEAKLALTALLEELHDIEVDGPVVAMPGIQANGVVALPLRFRAATA